MQRKRHVGSLVPARDRRTESELLDVIDRAAAVPIAYGFGAAVTARLDYGERRHGHAFTGRTVEALLDEAIEEAVDLPAWTLLAYVQADRLGTDQSTLDALRQPIVAAGVAAATAHVELSRAVLAWKAAKR